MNMVVQLPFQLYEAGCNGTQYRETIARWTVDEMGKIHLQNHMKLHGSDKLGIEEVGNVVLNRLKEEMNMVVQLLKVPSKLWHETFSIRSVNQWCNFWLGSIS